MKILAERVSLRLLDKWLLHDVSLRVASGQFVGLIGPNGSGKSTLLKAIYKVLEPDAGLITLDGQALQQMSARKMAQKMAVVSQESAILFDFTVREIVSMGRMPHQRLLQSETEEDRKIISEALTRVGMFDAAERSFTSLSGGEKQRVLIARALAQQAKVIILDEPTNHLDIRHQLQFMELIKALDITVLAALHDLNLAATYCDFLYVLQKGGIVAAGTPGEVFTPKLLREIFGVEAEVMSHPATKKPLIVFLSDIESPVIAYS